MISLLFGLLAMFELAVAAYAYTHRTGNFLIITKLSEPMTKRLTLFVELFVLAAIASAVAAFVSTPIVMMSALVLAALVSGAFSLQVIAWLKNIND